MIDPALLKLTQQGMDALDQAQANLKSIHATLLDLQDELMTMKEDYDG